MPTSLLNLKIAREKRGERPRNPEVEEAWQEYAVAFAHWANLSGMGLNTTVEGYSEAQNTRDAALISLKKRCDELLLRYFELFDKDQREAFGLCKVTYAGYAARRACLVPARGGCVPSAT
jgi:hypothetical protein